jgi:hypothetical protein
MPLRAWTNEEWKWDDESDAETEGVSDSHWKVGCVGGVGGAMEVRHNVTVTGLRSCDQQSYVSKPIGGVSNR